MDSAEYIELFTRIATTRKLDVDEKTIETIGRFALRREHCLKELNDVGFPYMPRPVEPLHAQRWIERGGRAE
jgi:hypothetical protein